VVAEAASMFIKDTNKAKLILAKYAHRNFASLAKEADVLSSILNCAPAIKIKSHNNIGRLIYYAIKRCSLKQQIKGVLGLIQLH
jgi:hypothetical protein